MNRLRSLLIALIFLLVTPTYVRAQAWSGILDPTRAIDWSTAGAGAIPARTTICSTLGTAGQASSFVQSVTVAQINSALSACPAGQTVLLSLGTYNTAGGTIQIPSNVTLRGSGPTQTIISETSVPSSGSPIPVIQFGAFSGSPYGNQPSLGTATAITGGTSQGSTQITVASASGISVGTLLTLSQANLSYMTEVGSGGTCSYCSGGEAGDSGQTVQVTAVNGTTLTISDPLYIAYTNSPVAYHFAASCISGGLENLRISASDTQTVNGTGFGYSPNIDMVGTAYSWVKNVESDFTEGTVAQLQFSMHNTIRDSFFHDAFSHASGTDSSLDLQYKASANLIENNIFWRLHDAIIFEWGASGNVISYNYMSGNFSDPAPNAAQTNDTAGHGAHPMMNLFEGNIMTHWYADDIHGSSSHSTIFRSYATGANIYIPPADARGALQMGSPTQENGFASIAYEFLNLNTLNNLVGIIDGSDYLVNTQHATSRLVSTTESLNTPACLSIGLNSGTSDPTNLVDSTMLYQGVTDCNTGTFQWQNGVQTLPASFYLSGKPSWWGSVVWPPIGPDVTNGNFNDWVNGTATTARGHVNKIPALNCFNSSTSNGTTNVTTFDANTCYTSSGTSAPAPPTALGAVVN